MSCDAVVESYYTSRQVDGKFAAEKGCFCRCILNTHLTNPKTQLPIPNYALALFPSPTGTQNVVKHSHPNNPAMTVENIPGPAKKNLQLNPAVGIKLKKRAQATGLNAFKTSSFPFSFPFPFRFPSFSTTRPKCQLNAAE